MDFSNIQFDKSMLSRLQNINPYEILGQLGLNKQETDEVLKGNFAPVTKPFIIDYPTFRANYEKYYNHNLVKYLFTCAFENRDLTIEEEETWKEGIEAFFKAAFYAGTDGIFLIEKNESLLINFEGSHYVMIKPNRIFYVK
jgi:hypothetical protein